MSNVLLCLNDKIENSNNKLQPTIFKAILNLFKKGFLQITSRMVKVECIKIDTNIDWNNRLKAICNSMRNSIECGGRIVGEDRDFNDFTIAFDGNSNNNLDKSKSNANPNVPKFELIAKNKKTIKSKINQTAADKKINDLLKSLDYEKLKNKEIPKLLIIGCSDSKTQGGITQIGINYFNSVQYNNLLNDRNTNKINYNRLFLTDPNYFIYKDNNINKPIKRSGVPVVNNYFSTCINGNFLKPALDRYAGGDFYKTLHISLYRQKNVTSNLHILIISGLYGVMEFNDTIEDYHLEINKLKYWQKQKSIIDTIKKYIVANKIDNKSVFYSLSDKYLKVINPPSNLWTNLWVKNGGLGSLKTSANVILRFLNKL